MLRLEVLSSGELEQLHNATLGILEKTGVKVMHDPLREKLAKAGADTDENGVVHLPAKMVEELLLMAPREVRLAMMDGKILHIGGHNRYYTSIVTDPYVIDFEQGPRRPRLEDTRRMTVIGDYLERVSKMSLMEYPPEDIPGPAGYLKSLEVFVTHTTKHWGIAPTSVDTMWQRIELAEILADGSTLREKPVLSVAATMTSPLTLTYTNAEIIVQAVKEGIPLVDIVSVDRN